MSLIDLIRERYERLTEEGGILDANNNNQGLLGNISDRAILGAAIYGQGLQGKDPLASFFPALTQTAQVKKLMTPKKANKFRALSSQEFENLKAQGVNLDPNKGYQINERTNEIKQIGSGQTINIGDTQKVASAATPEDIKLLGLNEKDDVIVFKKNNQIVDYKVNSYFDKRVERIGKAVKDSKLSEVDQSLKDIEDFIEGLDGKNLPGVGLVEGNIPGLLASEAGNELRALIQKYSNIKLQKRSGAAVTPSEFGRLQTELVGAVKTPDEETFLRILKRNREGLEKQKKQVFAPYRQDDLQQYFDSGGLSLYGETTQEAPASITLTPEQIKSLPSNILQELLKLQP
jgi:hypothetical protein